MKKGIFNYRSQPLIVLLAALFISAVLFSCTKDKDAHAPVFNPEGYWRGNANIIHTAILNKPDGKTRVYLRIFGADTASAIIGDGTFAVSGNSFKGIYFTKDNADTIFVETNYGPGDELTGQVYTTFTGEILDCTLRRQ